DERCPLERRQLFGFEFTQSASDGFARSSDDLADFFMGQSELHARSGLRLGTVGGPVEQEPGQFLRDAVPETQRANLLTRRVIVAAQLLSRPDGGLAVLPQEGQEIIAPDETHLAGFQRLGRRLMRLSRYHVVEPQHLALLNDSQDDRFT